MGGRVRARGEMRGEGPEREEGELSMEAREHRYLAQWLETNKMHLIKFCI